MQIDLFHMDEFIKKNNLKEVTNPITFDPGYYPTQDGILSHTIFGLPGSYDRKSIFAYIDLKKHFLHPFLYKVLTSMNRKLIKAIDGSMYFKISPSGELIEDPENGETGIDWIYKNFEKIKFKESDSNIREVNLKLLKSLKKNEIFITKFLVIPASYRDVDLSKARNGKVSRELINSHYTSLILLCQSENSEFDFMGHLTESKIQLKLVDIYEKLIAEVSGGMVNAEGVNKRGKEALFKRAWLGRTIDYSTRGVVSTPRIKSETPEDQMIKFTYTGIPLSHLANLFLPFFQFEIKSFFEEIFSTVTEMYSTTMKENIKLDNPMSEFTPEKIKNMILLFIKSPENRLDKIYVPGFNSKNQRKMYPLMLFENNLNRHFTLLDLIFIMAHRVCKDKHVYITRYPVDNTHSIYPSRIKIITTYKVKHVEIANMYFDDYPDITLEDDSPNATKSSDFIDTLIPHPSYLAAMSMDFDGDTISLRSVYSQEANAECERLINNINFIATTKGSNIRQMKNEGIQTLFTLTKEPKKTKKVKAISAEDKEYLLKLKPEEITLTLLKSFFTVTKNRKTKRFEPEDQVVLKAKEFYNDKEIVTTVGRLLFNKVVLNDNILKENGYYNEILNEDGIFGLDAKLFALKLDDKITIDDYYDYINKCTWIGYSLATYIDPSLTSDMYVIDKKIYKKRDELIAKNINAFDNKNSQPAIISSIENELLDDARESIKEIDGYQIYESGARGSYGNNFKNSVIMRGAIKDFVDPSKFTSADKSLVEGCRKEDFYKMANIHISGAYSRAKSTVKGGYLGKQVRAGFQHIVLDEKDSDCGSKTYLDITITDKNKKLFLYRYINVNGKLLLLDETNINKYIDKKVKMRSPLYCKSDKICNKCAGDLFYRTGFRNVGIMLDTASGILLNKSMKLFHDATVKTIKIDPLKFIKQLN